MPRRPARPAGQGAVEARAIIATRYDAPCAQRRRGSASDTIVHIERLDLRLLRLPLVRHFETSFGRTYDRTFLVVRLEGDDGAGWGECVADEHPYYSEETTETAWHVITGFVAPRVLGRSFADPREIGPALAAIRGHRMAKAAVEMAAWDLHARALDVPLWRLLGGDGRPVASGVSIGIQDTLDELVDRVRVERAAGYQRIKIKVKPGWDVTAVERLRAEFGGIPLMVDANAAYTIADADHLARFDAFDLMMIEQPLEYDDLTDHAALQRRVRTPICLDESIHSAKDASAAIAQGACRIVNIKPGRVGGHAESIRVHDACARAGVPVGHGGMLESGIGRAHNLHLSTVPNFTLPGDIAASRRYCAAELFDPRSEVSADGTVPVPAGPGIGVTPLEDRLARATERHVSLTRP
jgi:O-succinylbenzoate synthase